MVLYFKGDYVIVDNFLMEFCGFEIKKAVTYQEFKNSVLYDIFEFEGEVCDFNTAVTRVTGFSSKVDFCDLEQTSKLVPIANESFFNRNWSHNSLSVLKEEYFYSLVEMVNKNNNAR